MPKEPEPKKPDGLQSLERGLNIILAFDREHPVLTLATAAERTGLDRAIVRRAFLTLVRMGFVKQVGRNFRLTPKVMRLAAPFLKGNQFTDLAQMALKDFVDEFGVSASVCVLDEDEIVYVARAEARRLIRIDIGIGSRLPAHLTALGHVLLAAIPTNELDALLDRILAGTAGGNAQPSKASLRSALRTARKQRYAFVNGELEGGLMAVAVPVLDNEGAVAAAVGCSALVGQMAPEDMLRNHLDPLRSLAEELSGNALTDSPLS